MKKIVLLALVMSMFFTSQAQKNVAVYIASEQSSVTKILGDQLVSAFSKSSEYKAIERTSSFLAEISKEQGYQRTGAVDDKEISRLGKQFGVQYVCVADILEAFGKKYVSARLINVENAEIISTANVYSNLSSMEELIRVSDELKSQLLGKEFVVINNAAKISESYTDLGLPSGTKWKNDNVAGYFSYSEALNTFGSKLPTKAQWDELRIECTWRWTGCGYTITGPNGNSITLPAKGYTNEYGQCGTCSWGSYWTSTQNGLVNAWRYWFISSQIKPIGDNGSPKSLGCSVRLVQN